MEDHANQREYDRSPVELAVTLTLEDGRFMSGATDSVGMGGFGIHLAMPPAVGTRLTADLRFGEGPGAVTIRSAGTVVWVRGAEAGVAFTDTDAENHKKLRDLFLYNPMASAWD